MPKRVVLEAISSQTFEHEADRAALERLKRTAGFDRLMRGLANVGLDRVGRLINESSNIRLSERQVGSIYALHTQVAEVLDIEPPPLYLQHDVRINAYTSGVDAPFIVVTSGLVEGFSDEEIAYVLGHEMGHILAGHVLYRMVAMHLGLVLQLVSDMTPLGGLVRLGLIVALQAWSRCAELTADRAGLLAVQDPEVALRANMKLGAGPGARIARELNLEAFMEQVREFQDSELGKLDGVWRALLEFDRSHPWVVVRAHEIDKWVRGGFYQRILEGDYQKRSASVIAQDGEARSEGGATAEMAAAAEQAIKTSLRRVYQVHTAPRIPESPLHLALGTYVSNLESGERVIAVYDSSLAGHGDRGTVLTDRRVFCSTRPRVGAYYRDVLSIGRESGGLFGGTKLILDDSLEIPCHTRAVRDALEEALRGAITAFRGEPPQRKE